MLYLYPSLLLNIFLLSFLMLACEENCKQCSIERISSYNYTNQVDTILIEDEYCDKELMEVEGANNSVRIFYENDSNQTILILSSCK